MKMIQKIKIGVYVVLCSFSLQQMVQADVTPVLYQAPQATIQKHALEQIIQDPTRLSLPFDHVFLKEIYRGTSDRLIIHIQDAHSNLSGQQHLAGALDHFMKKYGIHLVLVEGADRDVTLTKVKNMADKKEWEIAAKRFLYDGLISGEEYLNLVSDHPMKIIGIENLKTYFQNVRAYSTIAEERDRTLQYLYRIRVSLNRLKNKMYPRTLVRYEDIKRKDHTEESMRGYERILEIADDQEIDFGPFSEVYKFKEIQTKEKAINFERTNEEQRDLFERLAKKGETSLIKTYTETARRSGNNQVSQYVLLNNILKAAEDNDINLEQYRNLLSYESYLEDFSGLRLDQLLDEVRRLEDITYDMVLESGDAKKTRKIDRFVELLNKAHNIKMTSSDFAMFKLQEPEFPTATWQGFMNKKLVEYRYFENVVPYEPLLDETRAAIKDFYRIVNERDYGFIENLNRVMSEQDAKVAFLVAGGYHTEHVAELLREQGDSYIVLTPIVSHETDHEKYEKLLLEPVKIEAKAKRRKAPHAIRALSAALADRDIPPDYSSDLRRLIEAILAREEIAPSDLSDAEAVARSIPVTSTPLLSGEDISEDPTLRIFREQHQPDNLLAALPDGDFFILAADGRPYRVSKTGGGILVARSLEGDIPIQIGSAAGVVAPTILPITALGEDIVLRGYEEWRVRELQSLARSFSERRRDILHRLGFYNRKTRAFDLKPVAHQISLEPFLEGRTPEEQRKIVAVLNNTFDKLRKEDNSLFTIVGKDYGISQDDPAAYPEDTEVITWRYVAEDGTFNAEGLSTDDGFSAINLGEDGVAINPLAFAVVNIFARVDRNATNADATFQHVVDDLDRALLELLGRDVARDFKGENAKDTNAYNPDAKRNYVKFAIQALGLVGIDAAFEAIQLIMDSVDLSA